MRNLALESLSSADRASVLGAIDEPVVMTQNGTPVLL